MGETYTYRNSEVPKFGDMELRIVDQTDPEYVEKYRGFVVRTSAIVYSQVDGCYNPWTHGVFSTFEEALDFSRMLTEVKNIYEFSV